jgi:hypothetical protein
VEVWTWMCSYPVPIKTRFAQLLRGSRCMLKWLHNMQSPQASFIGRMPRDSASDACNSLSSALQGRQRL